LAAASSDDSQEETNATSTEDKVAEVPVVEEEQNGNSEAESHVEHANGADKPAEEEIESIKRKSIEGEGDGPDSTEVTPKKAKLSEAEEEAANEEVDDDGVVPVVEAV